MNLLQPSTIRTSSQPHFRGPSWAPWKAFLAALFGLPLSDAQLDLYRRHTERQTAPTAPFNEAALVIGRRGGKSRVLALDRGLPRHVPRLPAASCRRARWRRSRSSPPIGDRPA